MSDTATATDVTTLIDRYIETWGETDAGRRRDLIARTWTEDGSYRDPAQSGDGHDGIDALLRVSQERFPGYRLRRGGEIDAYGDRVRFAWEMVDPGEGTVVVAGVDFGVLAADGRLREITGFFDVIPALPEGA